MTSISKVERGIDLYHTPPNESHLFSERQVKILTNTPLDSGPFQFGKTLNAVAHAFFSVLIPLLCKIFSSLRHHYIQLINLKGDLVQNKFDVLQAALETSQFDSLVKFADRGDFAGFENCLLESHKQSKHEVEEIVQDLSTSTLFDDVKNKVIRFINDAIESSPDKHSTLKSLRDDFSSTIEEDAEQFLKTLKSKAQEFSSVEAYLRLLESAVYDVKARADENKALEMEELLYKAGFKKESLQDQIDALAHQGYSNKNIEKYLLRQNIFGVDASDKVFQAGLFLLNRSLKPIRDRQFIRAFFQVLQNLRNSDDENPLNYQIGKKIRDLAFLASHSSLYTRLNAHYGRSSPSIALIQQLCTTLHMQVPGMREFRELGHMYLSKTQKREGSIPEEKSKVHSLASAMDEALERHKKFTFDFFRGKALTDNGNFDIGIGHFKLGARSLPAAFGSSVRGDKAFEMHLESLREKRGIHLQQGLPGSFDYLSDLEEKYSDVLRVFSMPLDVRAKDDSNNQEKYFLQFRTTEEFLLKYAKFAMLNQTSETQGDRISSIRAIRGDHHRYGGGRNDNGFYISKNVMNSHQFKLAFEKTAQAFSHVNPEFEDKKRLANALELAVQGFVTVGALIKTLQDLPQDSRKDVMNATFKQAFERDIDRGVVLNVLTAVYFQLLSGKPITEEVIQEVIGTVIARAELVAGSKVTFSDYQMLSDLLRLIGADENHVQRALHDYLQEGFEVDETQLCEFETFIAKPPDRAKRTKGTTEGEIFEGRKRFKPLQNSGSYGSIIYFDSKGKKYGVFKSVDAKFSVGKKMKSKALDALGINGQEGYLPLSEMRQVGAMISERVTFLLDQVLGTHSVPKTEIIYAQGHKGSFQHFLHGYGEADQIEMPTLENLNDKDIKKFQRFAILDYLLGNLDRKLDNWMVKMSSNGKHFKDIKMIDNANCFPRGHLPKTTFLNGSTWSQYAWKTQPISTIPLSKKSIKRIDALTDAKIDSIIQLWVKDLGPEPFKSFFGSIEGESIKAFKDRIRVLRQFARECKSKPRSLVELASYNTYESIKEYLGETEASRAEYSLPVYE